MKRNKDVYWVLTNKDKRNVLCIYHNYNASKKYINRVLKRCKIKYKIFYDFEKATRYYNLIENITMYLNMLESDIRSVINGTP